MIHYQPYLEHKESMVNWVSKVPKHWEVGSLKYCLFNIFNGTSAVQLDAGGDTVPVTRIESISTGVLNFEKVGHIKRVDADAKYRLQAGDVCFSNINSLPMIGNCAQYEGGEELYAGMNLLVLRPNKNCHKRWLYWLLTSAWFRRLVESLAKPAINQASISQGALSNIAISRPSLSEQKLIAEHLDRETARIDALIAKKSHFIELLSEKRRSIITQAVTKGLNPNVTMKDSGVEWLGAVPEHWVLQRLRYAVSLNPTIQQNLQDSQEVSFLPMEAIGEDGLLNLTRTRLVGEVKTGYSYFENGDVAFAKVTPCFENGKGAVMRNLYGSRGFGTTELTVLRPKLLVIAAYLDLVVRCHPFRALGEGAMTGAGGLKRVPDEFTRNFLVALPGIDEQKMIVASVDQELKRNDAILAKTERSIELLKERRSALITAAVTGQIDLREAA